MTFLDRDESTAARRTGFSARRSGFPPHVARSSVDSDNLGRKKIGPFESASAEQFDRVIRGNSAGRMVCARLVHEMLGRRPVAMAIEQRADDSAVQDAGKCFIFRLRYPLRTTSSPFDKTADAQPLAWPARSHNRHYWVRIVPGARVPSLWRRHTADYF